MGAYIDDVLSPISSARTGYDGWQAINIFPQCGSNSAVSVPWSLLPGRAWAWIVHDVTANFYIMRLISVCILLSWIGYTAWFLKLCFLPQCPLPYLVAGIICFTGLGTQTFAMVLNRPETAMIFMITLYVSLPFIVNKYVTPPRKLVVSVALVFCMVTSWFVSAHPKALFYAPLLFVSALYVCKWSRAVGGVLAGVVALTCYQAWASYWKLKMSCADSLKARHEWDNAALSTSLFFKDRAQFWAQLKHNLYNSDAYVTNIFFPVKTVWLPPASYPPYGGLINILIMIVIGLVLLWAVRIHTTVWTTALKQRAWKHPVFTLAPCLLAAAVAQCAIQSDKSFYNFSLVWVTLLLWAGTIAAYLSVHTAYWQEWETETKKGHRLLCALVGVSQCLLLMTYIPAAVHALKHASANGVIDNGVVENGDLTTSWGLISPAHYEERRERMLDAAQACHIPADSSGKHIVVDHFTYLPLKQTYQPFFLVFRLHEFDEPHALFTFLRIRGSSGLVTLCHTLPPQIRPYAKEQEGVCCISKEQIDGVQ